MKKKIKHEKSKKHINQIKNKTWKHKNKKNILGVWKIMNQTIKDLETRRSIRKFKDKQLTDEDLNTILKAGEYAPSGRGLQSAKILVIQDAEIIKRFSQWNKLYFPEELAAKMEGADPFFGAPTILLVVADSTVNTYIEDGSVVLGNILNAAHAVGAGGCWIHRAREEIDSPQGQELLKLLGLGPEYKGIGHAAIGYPADDENPKPAPRKEDYIVYVDKIE